MSGAVPKNKIKNRNFTKHFEQSVVNDIVDKTGVEEEELEDIQLQLLICVILLQKSFLKILI